VNSTGLIIAVVGVVIIIVGGINHFAGFLFAGTQHIDIYIGAVGLVVAVIGVVLGMRKAP
jgi:hypothetical protein